MSAPVLITGGAGFIGTNLAHRLLTAGRSVRLFDNLSQPGVCQNYEWLRAVHGAPLQLLTGDVRDRKALRQALDGVAQVYHFAAQTSVTSSFANPSEDFEVNARGTLNLLEELRLLPEPPPVLFTSTSKVYGSLEDIPLRLNGERYEPTDADILARGIGEDRHLDWRTPFACSKGSAEQYVLAYARNFGLSAMVFRLGSVHGRMQDHGWVSHFLIRAFGGQPITIYGDGKQSRDLLFVDDLVDALLLAHRDMRKLSGQAFNIGGGPRNSASPMELIRLIADTRGEPPVVRYGNWRPGDQRYFASDITRFRAATGWEPETGVAAGVEKVCEWLLEGNRAPVMTQRG